MHDFMSTTVNSENAAQISAEVSARNATERAANKGGATASIVGDVVRTTLASSTDALGVTTQRVEHRTDGFSRVNTSDLHHTSSGAPVFTSPAGRVLSANEVTPNTTVTIGSVTTNVRAAMHAGLLRQSEAGQYVSVSGVAAAPQAQQTDPEHQQQQEQQSEPSQTIEALDPQSEAIMSDVVSKVQQGTAVGTLRELIDNGEAAPSTIERVAEQLGVSSDEAGQRIETLRVAFDAQARKAIGGNSEAVFAYAREHQSQALKDAMRAHVMDGSTEGYRALTRAFIEDLARVNPQAILSSRDAAARGVRQERDGSITILDARAGRVEWRVAVRAGLIRPNFGG